MLPTNFIDKWFIELANGLDGYGMILFVFLTCSIAAALSALIGVERYRKGENAGIRTHALLAVGCSFFMTISMWAIRIPDPDVKLDITRIAAATVSGVGFLGAGVIIKDKFTVKGLSTATTIWICSAIGLATGSGFVVEAVIATMVTILVVFIRNQIIAGIDRRAPHVIIEADDNVEIVDIINETCAKNTMNLRNIDFIDISNGKITVKAYFPYHSNKLLLQFFTMELKKVQGIRNTEIVMKQNKSFWQGPHES